MNKVYVRWYNNVVEGDVVERVETGLFAGMLAVRIPIQGIFATAMFYPKHIYARQEDVPGLSHDKIPVLTPISPIMPGEQTEKAKNVETVSHEWMMLQQFKKEHWDEERGHINIDALEEFYNLWRDAIAIRSGMMKQYKPEKTMEIEKPSTPEEAMQPLKRLVSDERMEELKEQLKKKLAPAEKLTAKQKRSTGAIIYQDSIQTSFFD